MAGKLKEDLTGKTYGRLTVLERDTGRLGGPSYWLTRCSCGKEKSIAGSSLRSGDTTSCGCYHKELMKKLHTTHGHTIVGKSKHSMSSEYQTWQDAKHRCHNPKNPRYNDWGGRGIYICERWLESFQNFLDDMGLRPSHNHQLDRIDNDGPYSPENCRWATALENARNKRNTVYITHNNETKTLQAWAECLNISPEVIKQRLYRNWSVTEALTIPAGEKRRWA